MENLNELSEHELDIKIAKLNKKIDYHKRVIRVTNMCINLNYVALLCFLVSIISLAFHKHVINTILSVIGFSLLTISIVSVFISSLICKKKCKALD